MLQTLLAVTSERRAIYKNYCPEKKTKTNTDADASRQSESAKEINGIRDSIVMLQEGVHGGKFDGDYVFSVLSFFNAVHEPIQT